MSGVSCPLGSRGGSRRPFCRPALHNGCMRRARHFRCQWFQSRARRRRRGRRSPSIAPLLGHAKCTLLEFPRRGGRVSHTRCILPDPYRGVAHRWYRIFSGRPPNMRRRCRFGRGAGLRGLRRAMIGRSCRGCRSSHPWSIPN